MTVPETYLTLLQEAVVVADRAETQFRKSYVDRLRALEIERVFANRRMHFIQALSDALSGVADAEKCAFAGDRVLDAEFSLTLTNPNNAIIIERFRPVSQAIGATLSAEGEADHGAVLAQLADFENWYQRHTSQPFMALYDVYVQQTPVVDF